MSVRGYTAVPGVKKEVKNEAKNEVKKEQKETTFTQQQRIMRPMAQTAGKRSAALRSNRGFKAQQKSVTMQKHGTTKTFASIKDATEFLHVSYTKYVRAFQRGKKPINGWVTVDTRVAGQQGSTHNLRPHRTQRKPSTKFKGRFQMHMLPHTIEARCIHAPNIQDAE